MKIFSAQRALLLILLTLLSLFVAAPAAAQGVDWRERPTSAFTILYAAGSEAEAERYAAFVDAIYEEVALVFSLRTATPLTLRLFPTNEEYYQVNPQARAVPGVVAHADFRRRELVVIVEQTLQQTDVEVQNNVRHELTHIIAGELSESRLNTGFQEGTAQYLELPSGELERKIAALRQARDQGLLLPWSAFDERDQVYSRPEIGYPQTLSVVAFLIEREGFGTFREFLTTSARSSGYRSALERTYGVSATRLEQEWADWLPGYVDGGYRRNALASYDLTYPRQLVAEGRYSEADLELEQAIVWLEKNSATQPADLLAEATALRARATAGLRAERLAEATRQALLQADYDQAQQLLAQARDLYTTIGDNRQQEVLAEYSARIARGQLANQQLLQADAAARALRYPQARAAADAAAAEFASLGDQLRLDNALAIRQTLDERQRMLGAALLGLGMLGIAVSLFGQWRQRQPEVW
jgi:hypothetical protein